MNIEKVRNEIACKVESKADFNRLTEAEKVAYSEYMVHVAALKFEQGIIKQVNGTPVLIESAAMLIIAEDIRENTSDYINTAYIALTEAAAEADFYGMYKAVANSVRKWYRMEHGTPHERKHRYIPQAHIDFGAHCPDIHYTEIGVVLRSLLPEDERRAAYILYRLNGETAAEAAALANVAQRTGERALSDFRYDARKALGNSAEAEAIAIYWNTEQEA